MKEDIVSKKTRVCYNDKLDADHQISTEEQIAALIFDTFTGESCAGSTEESCADLGRRILYVVLREFRLDLFADANKSKGGRP